MKNAVAEKPQKQKSAGVEWEERDFTD